VRQKSQLYIKSLVRLIYYPDSTTTLNSITPQEYQAYRSTAQFISPDGETVQYYALLTAGLLVQLAHRKQSQLYVMHWLVLQLASEL